MLGARTIDRPRPEHERGFVPRRYTALIAGVPLAPDPERPRGQ